MGSVPGASLEVALSAAVAAGDLFHDIISFRSLLGSNISVLRSFSDYSLPGELPLNLREAAAVPDIVGSYICPR